MIEKYFGGKVPGGRGATEGWAAYTPSSTQVFDFSAETKVFVRRATEQAARCDAAACVGVGIEIVRGVDLFIAETRPFSLAKDMGAHAGVIAGILYACAEALRIASILLAPALPTKMAELWRAWDCVPPEGVPLEKLCEFAGPHGLKPGQTISKGVALFMRADPAEAAPSVG